MSRPELVTVKARVAPATADALAELARREVSSVATQLRIAIEQLLHDARKDGRL